MPVLGVVDQGMEEGRHLLMCKVVHSQCMQTYNSCAFSRETDVNPIVTILYAPTPTE